MRGGGVGRVVAGVGMWPKDRVDLCPHTQNRPLNDRAPGEGCPRARSAASGPAGQEPSPLLGSTICGLENKC